MAKDRDGRRESHWRRIMQEHACSGMSIREFCRKSQLRETTFHFWRRELKRRQVEDSTQRAEQEQPHPSSQPPIPAFVPVRVQEQSTVSQGGPIEIVLPVGRRLHVTGPVDRQALADVLAVLEAPVCAEHSAEGRPC